MSSQRREYYVEVPQMRGPCRTVYEDVIEEYEHKLEKERPHNRVHQTLESGRRVREPKRHYQELKVALMSMERCLLNIFFMHTHLVITRS